jgi:hypothetical protein
MSCESDGMPQAGKRADIARNHESKKDRNQLEHRSAETGEPSFAGYDAAAELTNVEVPKSANRAKPGTGK